MCTVLDVSISGYRGWKRGATLDRKRLTDVQMLAAIRAIHAELKGAYGSPRMVRELRRRTCWSGILRRPGPIKSGRRASVCRSKRCWSKVRVVNVMEKASEDVRYESGRRTTVNCRSSVESAQKTSKPGSDVAPRSDWPLPAYGSGGVRHRGSVNLIRALTLNYGNLRWRCEAKGTSPQGKADSGDAPPRGGAAS